VRSLVWGVERSDHRERCKAGGKKENVKIEGMQREKRLERNHKKRGCWVGEGREV